MINSEKVHLLQNNLKNLILDALFTVNLKLGFN